MKKLILIIAVLVMFAIALSAIATPSNDELSPATNRFLELKRKMSPEIRGDFDPRCGCYRNIYSAYGITFKRTATARIIADDFIRWNRDLFNIPNIENDVRFLSEDRSTNGDLTTIVKQQLVAGVPVLGSVITVTIDSKGRVRSSDNTLRQISFTGSARPSISREQAIAIVTAKFDVTNPSFEGPYIFQKEGAPQARLIYLIRAEEKQNHLMVWEFEVDARSREIVEVNQFTRMSLESCKPTVWQWDRDMGGYEYTSNVALCVDGNDYYLSSGDDYEPESYATFDSFYMFGNLEHTIFPAKLPLSNLPPPDTKIKEMNLFETHANMDDALKFFNETLSQEGYCKAGEKCPIKVYANEKPDKGAGSWSGSGYIGVDSKLGVYALTHEITHGLAYTYTFSNGKSKHYPYCYDGFYESAAIEEGLASAFGMLASEYTVNPAEYYLKLKDRKRSSINIQVGHDYPEYLDILNEYKPATNTTPEYICQPHSFGYIVVEIAKILYIGKINLGENYYFLDKENLFSLADVGNLYYSMLISKQNWTYTMHDFVDALMATCSDLTGTVLTGKQCANVMAVIQILKIPTSYDANNYSAGGKLYMVKKYYDFDFGVNAVAMPFLDKKTNYLYAQDISFALLTYDMDQVISPIEVQGVLDDKYYATTTITYNTLSKFESVGKVAYSLSSIADASPIMGNNGYIFPLFSMISAPQKYKVEYKISDSSKAKYQNLGYEVVDTNSANNSMSFLFGVDLIPEYDIKILNNGAPTSLTCITQGLFNMTGGVKSIKNATGINKNCQYKWEITLYARNIGNRAALPLIQSALIGSKDTKYGYIDMNITIPAGKRWLYALVEAWRTGKLEDGGTCLAKHPSIVAPGERFCAKKYEVIAKPGEEFTVMVDLNCDLQELNEANNIASLQIPTSSGDKKIGCGFRIDCKSPVTPTDKVIDVNLIRDNLKAQTADKNPPVGGDPIEAMFGAGEITLQGGQKVNSYEVNEKIFDAMVKDNN